MTEQPTFRLLTDPNRPGHRNFQVHMDRLVSENLDELNAMQMEAGAPLLADPFEDTSETEEAGL